MKEEALLAIFGRQYRFWVSSLKSLLSLLRWFFVKRVSGYLF